MSAIKVDLPWDPAQGIRIPKGCHLLHINGEPVCYEPSDKPGFARLHVDPSHPEDAKALCDLNQGEH